MRQAQARWQKASVLVTTEQSCWEKQRTRGSAWHFQWRPRPSHLLVRGERAGAPTGAAPTRLPASRRSFSSTMKRNCGAEGNRLLQPHEAGLQGAEQEAGSLLCARDQPAVHRRLAEQPRTIKLHSILVAIAGTRSRLPNTAGKSAADRSRAQHDTLAMRFTILSLSCGRPSQASPVTCGSRKRRTLRSRRQLCRMRLCRVCQPPLNMHAAVRP